MRPRAALILVQLACALLSAQASALEHTPVVRVDAAGGQIFFKSFSGTSKTLDQSAAASLGWTLADGVKVGEDDAAIATVSGQYLRRSQVNQIGGGGTLISKTLDDAASLRWVHNTGAWALKPNVEYKNGLSVSLAADRLGAGLFDLHQLGAGLEAEWRGEGFKSVRQTLGATKFRYYHYSAARSPLFGAELLNDDRNLDFTSYAYSVAADYAAWTDGLLSVSMEGAYGDYGHQGVINDSGRLTSAHRHDWTATWLLSGSQRWTRADGPVPFEATASFGAGLIVLTSNQNDLDLGQSISGKLRLNGDFYSYQEMSAGPVLSATFAHRCRATLTYNYARRAYRGRPVQDSAGNYQGGQVRADTHSVTGSASYQLGRGFDVQASAGYTHASANTHFESFYLYNYSYPFYFAGVGYSL